MSFHHHPAKLLLILTSLQMISACNLSDCITNCHSTKTSEELIMPEGAQCMADSALETPRSNSGLTTEQLAFTDAGEDEVEPIEIIESPTTGAALGWGWNRGDAAPMPNICVEFIPGEEKGQTSYMTMQEANDSYQLMKSMGMSAEASVKTIGYSASGKAEFAKSQNLSNTSSTFVLNATVQNGVRYASPMPDNTNVSNYKDPTDVRGGTSGGIRLTSTALKLAKSNLDKFKATCGSDFISAVYTGAKLTATISKSTESLEEKSSAKAEMSGSGTVYAAKIKAKVAAKANNQQVDESDKTSISVFMSGGNGQPIPYDDEGLLNALDNMTKHAYENPKDFQIAITPYELVENWPNKTIDDKEIEFEELATYWGAYNTLYDEIQQVLDNPTEYADISVDDVGVRLEEAYLKEQQALINQRKAAEKASEEADKNKSTHDIQVKALAANAPATPISEENLDNIDIEQLKDAQDEVLEGIKRMEKIAILCSENTNQCNFNTQSFRSPYAFRVQLPIPKNAEVTTFEQFVDYKIGRIAKRRCEISPNNSGCISNAEIAEWSRKIGLKSLREVDNPALYQLYAKNLIKEQGKPVKSGQAIAGQPTINCVANTDLCGSDKMLCKASNILWYNPTKNNDQSEEKN